MNKSQRILFNTGITNSDKYINVQLEQDVNTIEFLSMNIDTKDIYQNFNADYGVLIGRVVANGGIGIPNAKISIFIPLNDTDTNDSNIYSIYPYKTPRDKNNEGKRYNLLPRVAKIDPNTGISSPKQPFGSFPIKEEIVTNESYLNTYRKYYKHTALTNNSGDYMIFGVPIGTQTIHMSVDITDIGKYSMTPAAMVVNLGYSPNLFTTNGKIKPSDDLNDLPNIETQEITVNIVPFWGDVTNYQIGITRQDFRIRSVLKNTFVIFGSAFTDGDNSLRGDNSHVDGYHIDELYTIKGNNGTERDTNVGMTSKRIGRITEKIYYYPADITDTEIDMVGSTIDPKSSMKLLDPSEYSIYKRDGDFVFIISCNRNKVITDEFGNETSVPETSTNGVFTKFRGFITLEITEDDIPMNFSSAFGTDSEILPLRYKLKFPQYALRGATFTNGESTNTINWRKQDFSFSAGKLYSLAKFHGLTHNETKDDANQFTNSFIGGLNNGFFVGDTINNAKLNTHWNVGIIDNSDHVDTNFNKQYQFPSNSQSKYFGANWMNLSIYLPQIGYVTHQEAQIEYVRSADHFSIQNMEFSATGNNPYFYFNNTQKIADYETNTKWFARSDLNWTDIIEVPKNDILKMNDIDNKGIVINGSKTVIGITNITVLNGDTYRNGIITPPKWSEPCPIEGGKFDGDPANADDQNTYFYKGFKTADCIEYIISLNLV